MFMMGLVVEEMGEDDDWMVGSGPAAGRCRGTRGRAPVYRERRRPARANFTGA